MTYIIAEPCIDIKTSPASTSARWTASTRPTGSSSSTRRSASTAAPASRVPGRGDLPEDALPEKWALFVKIDYAYRDGTDVVDRLTDEYATGRRPEPALE